ncbi:SH3 domain-containing protein [Streptomyces flavotricini]|uniref:SH3 domain-containing protein n=1 Tax=Streptomyces flavotricini TaxID=66888 RepID=A0ABS8DYC2_9ACTN|nr:SH3 domain-containing protein [Streptomyces flavotricini]MCC0093722.1 SH3 domain-containing protein [Streptomyces flavotricini]
MAALGVGLLLQGAPAAAAAQPAAARPVPGEATSAAPSVEASGYTHVQGVVVSRVALHVRARATTSAAVLGSLDPFEKVQLSCQAKGSTVEGNNIWYRLHGEPGWVSARFVHNYTPVRWC